MQICKIPGFSYYSRSPYAAAGAVCGCRCAAAVSASGRIRTARVPRVRAYYRHPHAPRVEDVATAHSRRAFSRPLRLAVRSGPVTELSTARRY